MRIKYVTSNRSRKVFFGLRKPFKGMHTLHNRVLLQIFFLEILLLRIYHRKRKFSFLVEAMHLRTK